MTHATAPARRRRAAWAVALVGALVVSPLSACALFRHTETASLSTSDGVTVQMSARVVIGEPSVVLDTQHPLADADDTWTPLGDPVRLDGPDDAEDVTVTFVYPQTATVDDAGGTTTGSASEPSPTGTADAVTDAPSVVAYSDTLSRWVPVGGEVDLASGSVTVPIDTFTSVALVEIDADALADRIATVGDLDTDTISDLIATETDVDDTAFTLISGSAGAFVLEWCSWADTSVGARSKTGYFTTESVTCGGFTEEEQTYRLDIANVSLIPLQVSVPTGATVSTTADPDAPLGLAVDANLKTRGLARFAGARTASMSFAPASITATTDVTVSPDMLSTGAYQLDLLTSAVLGLDVVDDQADTVVQQALVDAGAITCLAQALGDASPGDAAEVVDSLSTLVQACASTVVPKAVSVLASQAGVGATTAPADVTTLLAGVVTDADAVALRTVKDFFPMYSRYKKMTLTGTYGLTRFLTADEVKTLPATTATDFDDDGATCGKVRTVDGFMPYTMTGSYDCMTVVEADLDADGADDRLVVAHAEATFYETAHIAVSAYLADGTMLSLSNKSALTDVSDDWFGANEVTPTAVVSLGPDTSRQVLVRTIIGASTDHHAVIGVVDGELQVLTLKTTDAPLNLATATTWKYTNSYGCALQGTTPVVVDLFAYAERTDDEGVASAVTWSQEVYELQGDQFVRLSSTTWDDTRKKPTVTGAVDLSDCTAALPSERGPALVTTH